MCYVRKKTNANTRTKFGIHCVDNCVGKIKPKSLNNKILKSFNKGKNGGKRDY